MTQINMPPSPDLPPVPDRGIPKDIAEHAAPSNDRLIVSFNMPSSSTSFILDYICQLMCSEITGHASRQEDTRDRAAYLVGWHDAIHSLRHLILSRGHGSAARSHIDGVPMAPEFSESVSLSDAINMLMSAPEPFTMTPSRPISSETSKRKEPQASLFSSGGLFSSASAHSRRPGGPCDSSMRFLNEDVPSNRSSFNSSSSSSTPFNTPSTSALSSPVSVDSVIGDIRTAHRRQSGPKTNRLNQSKIIKDIDTNKLLMLYEREARLSEHRIIAELARSNILRQSILQDRFFGNVPSFDADAPEVKKFGAEINEPFVGASQQKRTIQDARLTFATWALDEPSYERMLQPDSHHPPERMLQPSSQHPPETRRQPPARPTSVSPSTSNIFSSSGTSGTGSRDSSAGLFGGRSSPGPGTSGAGYGSYTKSDCLSGSPFSSRPDILGVSLSNPPTGGLFGGLSTPLPARHGTSREIKSGTSGVSSGSSSTGGLFGNLSAPMPAQPGTPREARTGIFGVSSGNNSTGGLFGTSREAKVGTSGVSSGGSSTGGLFGNLITPTPARSTTPRVTETGIFGVKSGSSSTGGVHGGLLAPVPAHDNPAKDTDIEREIRAESIVCGPTMRIRTDMYGRETFARSLLPHLPTIGGCTPQPVDRALWDRDPLHSDVEWFGISDWDKSCRELLAKERESLLSLSPARKLAIDSVPERASSFGEPSSRNDPFAHLGSGFIPVSSTPVLGNITNPDVAASSEPVELPASTRFDRHTRLPEPDSAEYAANSVKPLFSQITPSDTPKSPSSHGLRSRWGESGVNPLINLQTATRPLPSQRPVAAATSRYSPSMTRAELGSAGLSPPTSLSSITSSPPSLFQMPGQFPIQQETRPVPLVQVPTNQSEEDDGELPKIVLTSADSSDGEEEEDL